MFAMCWTKPEYFAFETSEEIKSSIELCQYQTEMLFAPSLPWKFEHTAADMHPGGLNIIKYNSAIGTK